jgi:hypothetical protein
MIRLMAKFSQALVHITQDTILEVDEDTIHITKYLVSHRDTSLHKYNTMGF